MLSENRLDIITEDSIRKIAQASIKGQNVERFVKVIANEKAVENDYNLFPSRYVNTSEKEEYRPIPEVLKELKGLEKNAREIYVDLKKVFAQMGFE